MRKTSEAEYSEFASSAWPQLYRTAVLIVADRQLAEDLVQSALVKTYVPGRDSASGTRRWPSPGG